MLQFAVSYSGASVLERMFRDEPIFTYAGLAMLVLCGPTLFLLYWDTRTYQGENVWIKPLKFEISIAIFLLTLAFFARYLPEDMTSRTDYNVYAGIVIFCAVVEIVWIAGSASFATASHFNTEPTMSTIYGFMGIVAVILTSATLVYGVAIIRDGPPSPFVNCVAISLILTFVLTLIVAFRLASNEGHLVGEPATGQILPVLGWSMEVGDLRVPHFFATHAMHLIPLLAIAIYALGPTLLTNSVAITVGLAYTAFTFTTFAQALSGRPFIS